MAAKGSVLKEQIIQKILETFPGAFKYDKEVRIPGDEGGEELQIKVTFTCAKVNVEPGEDTAVPGATATVIKEKTNSTSESTPIAGSTMKLEEPTEEEKKNVEDLLTKLGLK